MFDGKDETRTGHRRVKVETRPDRRRWSAEDKARIVTEATAPGAVVSAVARRWQVHPQQVFAWRREAACAGLEPSSGLTMAGPPVPEFVPILAQAAEPEEPVPMMVPAPAVEVELAGAVVRIRAGTDEGLLAAVLRAVRVSASA